MIIRGNTVGTNMSVDRIAEKIGGDALVVTLSMVDGGVISSHTSLQICEYADNGGRVVIHMSGSTFVYCGWEQRSDSGEKIARFASEVVSLTDGKCSVSYLFIDDLCAVTYLSCDLATADQIGDISSALDELHAYAQGLIEGGGSV